MRAFIFIFFSILAIESFAQSDFVKTVKSTDHVLFSRFLEKNDSRINSNYQTTKIGRIVLSTSTEIILTYSIFTGVSGQKILAKFRNDGTLLQEVSIEDVVDQDFTTPYYSSTSFNCINKYIFEVISEETEPLEEDIHLLNSDTVNWQQKELKNTKYYKYFEVNEQGEIIELSTNNAPSKDRPYWKVSQQLQEPFYLKKYSKSDLRIMRNEIFADYGYKFKSRDLREHFAKQNWYVPRQLDVTDSLTEIEKRNIQTILKLEKDL